VLYHLPKIKKQSKGRWVRAASRTLEKQVREAIYLTRMQPHLKPLHSLAFHPHPPAAVLSFFFFFGFFFFLLKMFGRAENKEGHPWAAFL
jgi:hypothetical protein